MATLKMKRYPRKPKASASVATMENYLSKCKDIDKDNAKRKAEKAKKVTLRKKISGVRQKL